MADATMTSRSFGFLLSEANGNRSRGAVTIPSGTGKVKAGTVLGEVSATPGNFVPSPDSETGGIEGAETAKAILGHSVDATSVDVDVAVVEVDAEVKLPMLSFDASVDDETKKSAKVAQLKAVGIRAR